jgi:ComF family protein
MKTLKNSWIQFAHLIYPTSCAFCEEPTPHIQNNLCPRCFFNFTEYSPFKPFLCQKCGQPQSSKKNSGACFTCEKSPLHFESLRSYGIYSGPLKKLILAFKYGGLRPLAKPLGKTLLLAPKPAWQWSEIDALVPIPMHQKRFLKRGFDHTLLLALSLQNELQKHFNLKIPVRDSLLRLNFSTAHQAGASRKNRQKNLQNAISVPKETVKRLRLPPSRILLIDDVVTTGATLNACAQALQNSLRNVKIHALALARTPHIL